MILACSSHLAAGIAPGAFVFESDV